MGVLQIMVLQLLLGVSATSVFDLGIYNSTSKIVIHFLDLASRCQKAKMILHPELDGVAYPSYGPDLKLPVISIGHGPRKMMLNFGTYGREFGETAQHVEYPAVNAVQSCGGTLMPCFRPAFSASADFALRLVEDFCSSGNSTRHHAILNQITIIIIPMLNIPGRLLVETSLETVSCGSLRTNENGVRYGEPITTACVDYIAPTILRIFHSLLSPRPQVDINRNFDFNWNYSPDNVCHTLHREGGNCLIPPACTSLLTSIPWRPPATPPATLSHRKEARISEAAPLSQRRRASFLMLWALPFSPLCSSTSNLEMRGIERVELWTCRLSLRKTLE